MAMDTIGRNMDVVKEKFVTLEMKGSDFGLKVNDTKIIAPSNRPHVQSTEIKAHIFKVVDEFVYVGFQLNIENSIMDEIKRRVTLGNSSYYSLLNLVKSKSVRRASKCTLYRSVIRPVVTYGLASWCMTQREEQTLLTFERKVVLTIFEPILDPNQN